MSGDIQVRFDTYCCGIAEIDGLDSGGTGRGVAKEQMLDMLEELSDVRWDAEKKAYTDPEPRIDAAFLIFTAVQNDTKRGKYGEKFAKFIRDNNLGTLTATKKTLPNPNHPDHQIKVWVWGVNHKRLRAWYKKNRRKDEEKEQSSYGCYSIW